MRERVEEKEREGGRESGRERRERAYTGFHSSFLFSLAFLAALCFSSSLTFSSPASSSCTIYNKRDKNKDSTCPSSSSL